MKTLTLFNAYVNATERMESALSARHTNFGIAVNKDSLALIYQRYDRLAHKLETHISARLGEVQDPRYPLCWRCGWPDFGCRCKKVQS